MLARGTVICKAPHELVVVVGCFQGFTVKAQSAALRRQELDHALPVGKADGGRTGRSTVKCELRSLFPSRCLRGTSRGPTQGGCPPGGQRLS